jgi:hypothetical protein
LFKEYFNFKNSEISRLDKITRSSTDEDEYISLEGRPMKVAFGGDSKQYTFNMGSKSFSSVDDADRNTL